MGIVLEDGSRVGVIGGGPAGAFCAYFLLMFAQRMDLDLEVDIYESRDFARPGPAGCNMCGGIVSESLVQALAIDGIDLPASVVQRGIDSYVLCTDEERLRIEAPHHEKRIAALHRGGGPRDVDKLRWGGLDGYLLGLAEAHGAQRRMARVTDGGWEKGRPYISHEGRATRYDLVIGATGVNSTGWQLFEQLGFRTRPPSTTKTYVTEIRLGEEIVTRHFGTSMHMFLLNLPRLDCAAIIPKGEFVTVCLLGKDIDRDLIKAFFERPAVRRCFPGTWNPGAGACHCAPKINVRETVTPYVDRIVLVGDCGVSRLYKDGIGAAYRTAKAAARTAIFRGVAATDFERDYEPLYRSIARDNRFGWLIFDVVHCIRAVGPLLRGVMRMSAAEQARLDGPRRMSGVLWDMFTGSAPYREIFLRTLDPRFLACFARQTGLAAVHAAIRGT